LKIKAIDLKKKGEGRGGGKTKRDGVNDFNGNDTIKKAKKTWGGSGGPCVYDSEKGYRRLWLAR